MSAMDHFSSIDRQLGVMREHFETELKAMKDQLFVAQAEARLAQEQLAKAVEARSRAERITARLLTQFGTVAMIFDEARTLAIEANKERAITEDVVAERLANYNDKLGDDNA